ncbi:(d)CMP kinase [Hathewaya histolytica]|uniref:Cytidylate kinase n=1 Tax=Hathewaya histolytica TaxID=1498 RepID=A0A4U9RC31_HATHI|nr:(d)CMP kinase [Hathewaya histolytica]VTQ89295.1 cytidylate kinase [Hathewaya histolytica]
MRYNIAIDGPAGAGKSTIAKLLAKELNLMYINTGAMYRAVAYLALKNNIDETMNKDLEELIDKSDMYFQGDNLILNGIDVQDQITTPYISNNVSKYAANKLVRQKLVLLQQKIALKHDVVMDGRDICTVVLKDAAFKFFLTASPEERATRRYNELRNKNMDVEFNSILNDIIKRDEYDSTRKVDPLKRADDAILVDSTGKTIKEVVDSMIGYINPIIMEDK